MPQPRFHRTIGIDYSGAGTAEAGLTGLRVYQTLGDGPVEEVLPPQGRSKYWTRRGVAAWLIAALDEATPTIVGIDHGFSVPLAYFDRHALAHDWPRFLDDFCAHWPTDAPQTSVEQVRRGLVGNGAARAGDTRWRRVTEKAAGAAKSVFHFDVQGSVAKSTHAGLPWLRQIRRARPQLHFWPFDGWTPAPGASVIAEAYPRLWSASYPPQDRSADQHDAYAIARALQDACRDGGIERLLAPPANADTARIARVEGWILGTP